MSLYINEKIKRLETLDQKCGLIQQDLSRRKEEIDRHNEIASLEERLSNTSREKTSPNDREKAGDETSSLFLLNSLGSNESNNPLYRDALRERLQELQGTTPTAVKIPDRDLVSQLQALPSIDYKLSQDLDLTDSNALTHIILGTAAARQALKKQVKNLQQQREDLRQ